MEKGKHDAKSTGRLWGIATFSRSPLRPSAPREECVAKAEVTLLLRFGEVAGQREFHGMEDYEQTRAHLEFAAVEAHLGEDGAQVGEAFPVYACDLRR